MSPLPMPNVYPLRSLIAILYKSACEMCWDRTTREMKSCARPQGFLLGLIVSGDRAISSQARQLVCYYGNCTPVSEVREVGSWKQQPVAAHSAPG